MLGMSIKENTAVEMPKMPMQDKPQPGLAHLKPREPELLLPKKPHNTKKAVSIASMTKDEISGVKPLRRFSWISWVFCPFPWATFQAFAAVEHLLLFLLHTAPACWGSRTAASHLVLGKSSSRERRILLLPSKAPSHPPENHQLFWLRRFNCSG